jgi:ubiquinone/menaquinone biosynthesis C-methylase UbiE
MTHQEIEQRIEELGPWFYPFDFGRGLRTTSVVPPHVKQIFDTRLEMVNQVVQQHFGPRLGEINCLDVGCHEGFYSFAMARLGAGHVTGVDVRESNLRKARFAAELLGYGRLDFRQYNLEQLHPEAFGFHELTLFLGLLYHLENPMLCLRNLSSVTKELCVVETQVVSEVSGEAEWGSRDWTRPYQGILALIDESGEFYADNPETGHSPVATCPSPRALEFMLKQAGFREVEFIEPPAEAYEQHARRKRVVCAAYK